MCAANTFLTNKFHFNFLTRSQFSDQNVIMEWSRRILSKSSRLVSNWNPFKIARVHIRMIEYLLFLLNVIDVERGGLTGVFLTADHVQLESQTVPVIMWLRVILEFEKTWIHHDRNQAHSMCQILIWNDWCVLPHFYFFDSHSGDLSNQNSS